MFFNAISEVKWRLISFNPNHIHIDICLNFIFNWILNVIINILNATWNVYFKFIRNSEKKLVQLISYNFSISLNIAIYLLIILTVIFHAWEFSSALANGNSSAFDLCNYFIEMLLFSVCFDSCIAIYLPNWTLNLIVFFFFFILSLFR